MPVLQSGELAGRLRTQAAVAATEARGRGIVPALGVCVFTDEALAATAHLELAATEAGIVLYREAFPDLDTGSAESSSGVIARVGHHVRRLVADPAVHGVLCAAPLPAPCTMHEVGLLIPVERDVYGCNPATWDRLAVGQPAFATPTAQAVLEILRFHGIGLSDRTAVVVGRSSVFGLRLTMLLSQAAAAVTMGNYTDQDIGVRLRLADLVVVLDRPELLTADMLGPDAIVVNVSEEQHGRLNPDVDDAATVVSMPTGIGPVALALLLNNVVTAAAVTLRPLAGV